jgi:membrane protease subunit (stomatin/prohibitin family)
MVENVSLPEELQKLLDTRIGMNMIGDMGRYQQFQMAQSMPIAAANEGGAAGLGMGFGAGMAMGQQMMNSMQTPGPPTPPASAPPPVTPVPGGPPPAPSAAGASKFCINCGKAMPKVAKFCPECGSAQQ